MPLPLPLLARSPQHMDGNEFPRLLKTAHCFSPHLPIATIPTISFLFPSEAAREKSLHFLCPHPHISLPLHSRTSRAFVRSCFSIFSQPVHSELTEVWLPNPTRYSETALTQVFSDPQLLPPIYCGRLTSTRNSLSLTLLLFNLSWFSSRHPDCSLIDRLL